MRTRASTRARKHAHARTISQARTNAHSCACQPCGHTRVDTDVRVTSPQRAASSLALSGRFIGREASAAVTQNTTHSARAYSGGTAQHYQQYSRSLAGEAAPVSASHGFSAALARVAYGTERVVVGRTAGACVDPRRLHRSNTQACDEQRLRRADDAELQTRTSHACMHACVCADSWTHHAVGTIEASNMRRHTTTTTATATATALGAGA